MNANTHHVATCGIFPVRVRYPDLPCLRTNVYALYRRLIITDTTNTYFKRILTPASWGVESSSWMINLWLPDAARLVFQRRDNTVLPLRWSTPHHSGNRPMFLTGFDSGALVLGNKRSRRARLQMWVTYMNPPNEFFYVVREHH